MAELNYSPSALNSLNKFHRVQNVVYVEGDDDKPFWNMIFGIAGIKDCYFKVAGGKAEIGKYERRIIDESVNIIVARDADYTDLFDGQIDHPRIIYTYGYSIENTLYCSRNIAVAVSILSRSAVEEVEKVEVWMAELAETIRPLLIYDVANELFGKGVQILGDNCSRFLKSNSSPELSRASISKFLERVETKFGEQELKEAAALIDRYGKEIIFLIRGHFLSNAVSNFIKSESSLTSMPKDMLYGQMLGQLPAHCQNNKDVMHLVKSIVRTVN